MHKPGYPDSRTIYFDVELNDSVLLRYYCVRKWANKLQVAPLMIRDKVTKRWESVIELLDDDLCEHVESELLARYKAWAKTKSTKRR